METKLLDEPIVFKDMVLTKKANISLSGRKNLIIYYGKRGSLDIQVSSFRLKELGLQMKLRTQIPIDEKEIELLKELYYKGTDYQGITDALNKKFGNNRTKNSIAKIRRNLGIRRNKKVA